MNNLKKLTGQIEKILEDYPKSRNCDKVLTLYVWWIYYPHLINNEVKPASVPLDNILALPSQDAVKRIRAKIQNVDEMFLPTDPEVAKRRKWNIERWRKLLGYPTQEELCLGL